jgi:tartrate-resistant acid phosphatase type 5
MRERAWILALTCALAACAPRPTPETPLRAAPPVTPAADVCAALLAETPQPPPPPAIRPADQPIRMVAFGDFGDGAWNQKRVAHAVYVQDRRHPFDFGLTLGDNFYPKGLDDPADPRWTREWEMLYTRMHVRFYATLGNHDYYAESTPDAEIRRSAMSESWCLPRRYYTFTAGPVQFFAIDTNPIVKGEPSVPEQLAWLDGALAASSAPWKVVYGHHPVYSVGEDGSTPEIIAQVLPLLRKHEVDVYLSGHEHDMEYLRPEGSLHFFVAGAGGHLVRPLGKDPEGRRRWAKGKRPGFLTLESSREGKSLRVSFFNTWRHRLCRVELFKGAPARVDCPAGS